MPIDLGINYDEWEKEVRPPLIVDGAYVGLIQKIEEGVTGPQSKTPGRPQWRVECRILNRPDYPNRVVSIFVQLPWINPSTGLLDRSNTFTLKNLMDGTGVQMMGNSIPDKEFFLNREIPLLVGQKTMPKVHPEDPDEEENIVQKVNIITKRRGGNVA